MNKSAIKNCAVTARTKLMEATRQKAYELGITETEIKKPEVYQDGFRIHNQFFKKYQMKQRDKLLQKVKDQGLDQVIEEVAYTWFNRLIAIRFMEVNEYLPTGVRVLSSLDREKVEPDAVTEVLSIAEELELHLDVVYRLQDENQTEELFKYILVKQCNKLGEIMPMMFEQIEDYTELLLPDKLLAEGSVVRNLVTLIDEEDWKEQVEIIGWLYQYYISEKKDQVFADLKKNKKITKENIPAATQLFTPKWIVQYMVENSLGRLWLESHPDESLQKEWTYYLEEAEQDLEVKEQLDQLKNKELSPEEIKVLDPCMGSGHMLVYAFDVLYKIYQNAGYSEREIPQFILEKNLYGLDIDDRAAQLAYFTLMMKARSVNRRIFKKPLDLHICSIQESNNLSEEVVDYFIDQTVDAEEIQYLSRIFKDAKEYGSILEIKPLDCKKIEQRLDEIDKNDISDIFSLDYRETLLQELPKLVKQAKILSQQYEVVLTNPPYMGKGNVNSILASYIKEKFPWSNNDLYSIFIKKCMDLCKDHRFVAMITQHSWMFVSSYEEFRRKIYENFYLDTMVHLGPRAFEEISGEVVQTTAFVFRKKEMEDFVGQYIKVNDISIPSEKEKNFHDFTRRYKARIEDFKIIPKHPMAYWISEKIKKVFEKGHDIIDYVDFISSGNKTANNDQYVRFFWEVPSNLVGEKWIPYAKGGQYRKWYGNLEYVVDWSEQAQRFYKTNKSSSLLAEKYCFKTGITYTDLTSKGFNGRLLPNDALFDMSGPSLLVENAIDRHYLISLLNSAVAEKILELLNSSFHIKLNDIVRIPIIYPKDTAVVEQISELASDNISISAEDWNHFETSLHFKLHPLLKKKDSLLLRESFQNWVEHASGQHQILKENEEKLNQIFIKIYGLKDELAFEVDDKNIALYKADLLRDMKSFISYGIGCLLGRYSLDQEGLVFAGGRFDASKYSTFKADSDNIIPITDDEYFEDDIVSRFIDFVRVTFGQETLEENLDFIAEALSKKANETSRQRIRRYFVKEFYKDHLQMYQKRPIYWLFDSGKQEGFKALIYMHRYDGGTIARVRTEYLHTLQRKYESEMARLDVIQESDVSAQEKTSAKKQKEKIQKQLLECQQYDLVIAHMANQQVDIDLDDGVKVNYAKFQNIEISQGEGKRPLKADLLGKI